MKKRLLSGWPLLFALVAGAQVQMDLVTEQDHFLPDETLRVGVRIDNLSGQTLRFDQGEDWIHFQFESVERVTARQARKLPMPASFEVRNAERAVQWFDVAPYYELGTPGRYRVNALVTIKQWNEDRASRPASFEIVSGTVLWEQAVGVPPKPGQTPGPPEVRKYILQQARLQDAMKLYLRVTDESGVKVFRVTPIDRLIQLSQPERQIDRDSCLHVLHQIGMRSFNYSVFDPDGTLVLRQRHDYNEFTGSRPRLGDGGEGRIIVRGGVRKEVSTDFPPDSGNTSK